MSSDSSAYHSNTSSTTSTKVASGSESAVFRDTIRKRSYALKPLDTKSFESSSKLSLVREAAENAIVTLTKLDAADEVAYQTKIVSFLEHLVPSSAMNISFTGKAEFQIQPAGSGRSLTDILVENGKTWGEIAAVRDHRDWHERGKQVLATKMSSKRAQSSSTPPKIVREAEDPSLVASTSTTADSRSRRTVLPSIPKRKQLDLPPNQPKRSKLSDNFGCYKPDFLGYAWINDTMPTSDLPQPSLATLAARSLPSTVGPSPKRRVVTVSSTGGASNDSGDMSNASKKLHDRQQNGYSFCSFITGELKPRGEQFMEGLTRQMCYTHAAFQLCGCWIGICIIEARFSRMVMVDEGTIAVETLDKDLQDRLRTIPQAMAVTNGYNNLAFSLGSRQQLSIDAAGWVCLWNTFCCAARLVADLPIDRPLQRLRHPTLAGTPAWSLLTDLIVSAGGQPAPESLRTQAVAVDFIDEQSRLFTYASAGASSRENNVKALYEMTSNPLPEGGATRRLDVAGLGSCADGAEGGTVARREEGEVSSGGPSARESAEAGEAEDTRASLANDGDAANLSVDSMVSKSTTSSIETFRSPTAALSFLPDPYVHADANADWDEMDSGLTSEGDDESDRIAEEWEATREAVGRLIDLDVKVIWITPEHMTELINEGVEKTMPGYGSEYAKFPK